MPFPVAEDLGGPDGWTFALSDQRHRAVFNGIWQVGHGFQVSGLHYWGAGNRAVEQLRRRPPRSRRRRRGALCVRDAQGHDRPEERVHPAAAEPNRHPRPAADSAAEPVSIDLIAEAFNVFNRPNWTLETQESSADYGKRGRGAVSAPRSSVSG